LADAIDHPQAGSLKLASLKAGMCVFHWLWAAGGMTWSFCAPCSNPLAGTDSTLLALSGLGYMGGKLFGFASCPRAVGAAEGMNVLAERRVPLPPHQGGQPYTLVVVAAEYSVQIPTTARPPEVQLAAGLHGGQRTAI
jgi:hypothetical protein